MNSLVQSVLVVKMSAIGDVIHALPVSYAIKETFPDCHLTWVVENSCRDLVTHNPYIDEVIAFPKKNFRSLSGLIHNLPPLKAQLTARPYDVALDLQGLFKSAVIVYLSQAKKTLGFCNMRELSYFMSPPVCGSHKEGHIVERYLDVARAMGCAVNKVQFPLQITADEATKAGNIASQAGLSPGKTYVVLAPGANWVNKRWPTAYFAEICNKLSHRQVVPVLIGAANDRALADAITAQTAVPPVDLIGRTSLMELATIIQRCQAFVGGDTGPLHLAAALGRSVVGLYGPTDTNRNGPYGQYHFTHTISADCAGCWKRQCPRNIDCLAQISIDEVWNSLDGLLSE
jgi:heptosyltransferase-1